jgi:hypothetical protein
MQKLEKEHRSEVLCVDCHPEKSIIASCSRNPDNAIRLWADKTQL